MPNVADNVQVTAKQQHPIALQDVAALSHSGFPSHRHRLALPDGNIRVRCATYHCGRKKTFVDF